MTVAETSVPSPIKVLVVDDDATIRSTLAAAVSGWGYRPLEATTLAETLTIIKREQPHALLLDAKLPDGSGIEALDTLRKRSPELVIIIITAYDTTKHAFEAGMRQAYGYVPKPIDQEQLRLMLEQAFRNRPRLSYRNNLSMLH